MPEITIRGRIATTHLARGTVATVEHTDTIDRLIAGGYVETVGAAPASVPEQVTAVGGLAEPRVDAQSEPEPVEGEPEAEAVARPRRRKTTS